VNGLDDLLSGEVCYNEKKRDGRANEEEKVVEV
jgi:hypothetical protein